MKPPQADHHDKQVPRGKVSPISARTYGGRPSREGRAETAGRIRKRCNVGLTAVCKAQPSTWPWPAVAAVRQGELMASYVWAAVGSALGGIARFWFSDFVAAVKQPSGRTRWPSHAKTLERCDEGSTATIRSAIPMVRPRRLTSVRTAARR